MRIVNISLAALITVAGTAFAADTNLPKPLQGAHTVVCDEVRQVLAYANGIFKANMSSDDAIWSVNVTVGKMACVYAVVRYEPVEDKVLVNPGEQNERVVREIMVHAFVRPQSTSGNVQWGMLKVPDRQYGLF